MHWSCAGRVEPSTTVWSSHCSLTARRHSYHLKLPSVSLVVHIPLVDNPCHRAWFPNLPTLKLLVPSACISALLHNKGPKTGHSIPSDISLVQNKSGAITSHDMGSLPLVMETSIPLPVSVFAGTSHWITLIQSSKFLTLPPSFTSSAIPLPPHPSIVLYRNVECHGAHDSALWYPIRCWTQ